MYAHRKHMQPLLAAVFCVVAALSAPDAGAGSGTDAKLSDAMLELSKGNEDGYRRLILRLCEKGNLDSQLAYGKFLIAKREYVEAERWLNEAAKSESSESQYMLGFLYLQMVPARLDKAKQLFDMASKKGHARAAAVLQMLDRKPRSGPPGKASVLDILEGAATMGRVKVDDTPERDVRCSGHTPDSFKTAVAAAHRACLAEVHKANGDWVSTDQAKSVGIQWAQCTNREVFAAGGTSYQAYMQCRWPKASGG